MRNRTSLILFFLFVTVFPECISGKVVAGAGRFEQYLPFIQGKRVGMVVNHTSVVGTGADSFARHSVETAYQRSQGICPPNMVSVEMQTRGRL